MEGARPFRSGLSGKLRAVLREQSFRETAFVFALTRAIVLVIFVAAGSATLNFADPAFSRDDQHPIVKVRLPEVKKQLNYTLTRGDAGWYLGIAQNGYERHPFEALHQHNWVFFPLYPLLVRPAGQLTGEYLICGAILSNALLFVALLLLHKLVTSLGYDVATAGRAIFYTATFPASYFFSLPVTESLFLCLVVASFFSAIRRRWWAAGLLGGLASATRLSGILLLPALALFCWQRREGPRWRRDLLWLALVPAGCVIFSLYLWKITGNPLAQIDAVAAWQRKSGFFLTPLYQYLIRPLQIIEPWNFRALNFAAAILTLGAAHFWLLRRQWALATFTFLAILLPLSSSSLLSMARYVAVIFPVFIALALAGRRSWPIKPSAFSLSFSSP